ncbi:MAG: TRAP transporter permease, partial [bacterium]
MLIKIVAGAWSLFQLGVASVVVVSSTHIRSIHLAFALALIYLTVKPKRGRAKIVEEPVISSRFSFRWWELLLALAAALSALYIVMDYAGIASRIGQPIPRDRWLSLGLILFLFEASRRILGPALPSIGLAVSLLAFFGPHLPTQIAFRGVSLDRYLTQIALTNEGIFGIPLGVSANFVFLFVLLGALLDRAGGGKWFIEIATALLGRFRGGPAKAAVVASGLVGTVSGSSIANVVTSGTFTIPLMKSIGYPPYKAGAIETAASTYGQLMPPIMGAAAFIMAEYLNLPYIAVIKSALLPAIMAYTGLFFVVHLEALKLGLKGLPPEELPHLKEVFLKGIHFLIPLGVLIYKLVILRHTPESSAFFTVIALVGVVSVKELGGRWLSGEGVGRSVKVIANFFWNGLTQGAISMTSVAVATACAGVVIGVMMMGPGGLINEAVERIAGGKIIILLLMTTVACLILGMGLPTTANYIVMASLTAPILVHVGAKAGLEVPIIAAHMFIFFYGVQADITPPVALAAYAASGIAGSEPLRTGVQAFRYALPTFLLP